MGGPRPMRHLLLQFFVNLCAALLGARFGLDRVGGAARDRLGRARFGARLVVGQVVELLRAHGWVLQGLPTRMLSPTCGEHLGALREELGLVLAGQLAALCLVGGGGARLGLVVGGGWLEVVDRRVRLLHARLPRALLQLALEGALAAALVGAEELLGVVAGR